MMRVRVEYSIFVDDKLRRGINAFYGRHGLADRNAVKQWYRENGTSSEDDAYELATIAAIRLGEGQPPPDPVADSEKRIGSECVLEGAGETNG